MRAIKTVGDEVLKKVARKVIRSEIPAKAVLIEKMISSMRAHNGVGLAAPQIGVSEKIAVVEIGENERYPNMGSMPLLVLINPSIKILDKGMNSAYEGCLSVPGIRGLVPRYNKIMVTYLNSNGREERKILTGFPARVVQHENDHLDGVTFLERVIDHKSFITDENYQKYILSKAAKCRQAENVR